MSALSAATIELNSTDRPLRDTAAWSPAQSASYGQYGLVVRDEPALIYRGTFFALLMALPFWVILIVALVVTLR